MLFPDFQYTITNTLYLKLPLSVTSMKEKSSSHRPKFKQKKNPILKKQAALQHEIDSLKEQYKGIKDTAFNLFTDFPISSKTKKGLELGKYRAPTDVQRLAIPEALLGEDILGAAKTGSGKTLAFLIPVLERLFVEKWSAIDGLGALIISPTRELAYQTFNVLRVVGKYHDFSAGLVIGGKHLSAEAEKINNTNIVICTPGRLLQHMDETFNFNVDNLQILVLDEADRILDLGFARAMNAIIENMPPERQTLLFSATQTNSLKDLVRLSLKEPMLVSVHAKAEDSTPSQLTQSFVVCEQHEKLDILWFFIKTHLKRKSVVFLSCCKQVRFVYEAMRRMRPGVPLMCLHGHMKQTRRIASYESFKSKQFAVLLATDIAARGLDFPAVHWVVQLDCPESVETYIHRAGRTARYQKDGEALLVLTPRERRTFVPKMEARKIRLEEAEVDTTELTSIQPKLQSLLAADVALKEFAQRCFVSYMKTMFLRKDKQVFDVASIDTDALALSLGLAVVPRLRFLKKSQQKKQSLATDSSDVSSSDESEADQRQHEGGDRLKGDSAQRSADDVDDDDDDDADLFTLKKTQSGVIDGDASDSGEEKEASPKNKATTKAALAKKMLRKNITANQKVLFDEEDEEVVQAKFTSKAESSDEVEDDEGGINIEEAKQRMRKVDAVDKETYRAQLKRRKQEAKEKRRAKRKRNEESEEEEDVGVTLGGNSDDDDRASNGDVTGESGDKDDVTSYFEGEEGSSGSEGSDSDDSEANASPPAKKLARKRATSSRTRDAPHGKHLLEDDEMMALHLLSGTS